MGNRNAENHKSVEIKSRALSKTPTVFERAQCSFMCRPSGFSSGCHMQVNIEFLFWSDNVYYSWYLRFILVDNSVSNGLMCLCMLQERISIFANLPNFSLFLNEFYDRR